jgi:hypothetical protein
VHDGIIAQNNPILLIDPWGLKVGDWWDLPANYGRAREIAREELQKRPTQHNDIGDAMRHAEWNRRMVEETNSFTAWTAGVGHEVEGLLQGQPLSEAMMDLHNNAVGRAAGSAGMPVDPNRLITSPDNASSYNPYGGNCSK